jgi:hypothetical protein
MPARSLRSRLVPCLSILGLVLLCFLPGMAVMLFRLPTPDFLEKAFRGGENNASHSSRWLALRDFSSLSHRCVIGAEVPSTQIARTF